MLRMTAQQVADASGLGVATVRRAESGTGPISITKANTNAIIRALEAAGVEFLDANGGGPGVRLRHPSPPSTASE